MKARTLRFAGDPKVYIEIDGAPMLPHVERVFNGSEEIRYLRKGYDSEKEADSVIVEILKAGMVQKGEWR